MKLRRCRKRGQATAIGGVLFLMIAILLTNFLYDTFDIQRDMNFYDSLRAQEQIKISGIFFGNKTGYAQPDEAINTIYADWMLNETKGADPYTVITSNYTGGFTYPIGNGEFTTDTQGWYFVKEYTEEGVFGASGAYTVEGTGSQSGPGAVFMDFVNNPDSGTTINAELKWVRSVFIDLESVGNTSAIDDIILTWGRKTVLYTNVHEASIWSQLTYNDTEYSNTPTSITDLDIDWDSKSDNYTSIISSILSNQSEQKGWFKIAIVLNVTLQHSNTFMPELKILIDDVDFQLSFRNHVTDWSFTYTIDEDPSAVAEIDLTYTSHYNRSDVDIIQTLYIKDQATGRDVKLSRSTISTADVSLVFNLQGDNIQSYVSESGNITMRIYTIASKPFQGNTSLPMLEVLWTGTDDHIILTLENSGGVTVTIVSLWVIDYNGHNHTDYRGQNTEFRIAAGETYRLSFQFLWSAGEYTFKIATEKGTVVKRTAYAL